MKLNHVVHVPHLRKAENRIMASLVPDLRLYASWDKRAEELPSRETSEALSGAER